MQPTQEATRHPYKTDAAPTLNKCGFLNEPVFINKSAVAMYAFIFYPTFKNEPGGI